MSCSRTQCSDAPVRLKPSSPRSRVSRCAEFFRKLNGSERIQRSGTAREGVGVEHFPTYVGSGHFLVQNFEFHYLFIFFFWGGGVQRNEYFFGYEDFVDIFWGSSQN